MISKNKNCCICVYERIKVYARYAPATLWPSMRA